MRLQGGDQEQVRRALPVLLRLFGSVLTNPHRIPLPPGLNCSYRFSHLMYIRQALAHSTKTSLRTDENGILSMQFMIASAQAASEGSAFVEFTCMPQNDEDEEDDGV